jgi:hypothetical protein
LTYRFDARGLEKLIIVVIACASFGAAQAQQGCEAPSNAGGFGPFDYRTDKSKLPIVETYHFTPEVETLRRGKSSSIGDDLNYTLTAFPNHHRALMSMVNLVFKEKRAQPEGAHFTIECYFQRAEQFRPDDAMVKVIHGIYLTRAKKPKEALVALEAASAIAGDDPNVNYNLALGLLEAGRVDEAVEHARIAYRGGFPLPGLRNKLKALGKWTDTDQDPSTAKK